MSEKKKPAQGEGIPVDEKLQAIDPEWSDTAPTETPLYEDAVTQIRQSGSIVRLMRKLTLAQAKFGVAKKDKDNPYYKSKYADFPEIVNATRTAMAEVQVAVMMVPFSVKIGSTDVLTNEKTADGGTMTETLSCDVYGVGIRATFMDCESGEFIECRMTMAPQNPSPQAGGSCLTYLARYIVRTITGVVTDDDDDGNAASTNKRGAPAGASQRYNAAKQPVRKREDTFLVLNEHADPEGNLPPRTVPQDPRIAMPAAGGARGPVAQATATVPGDQNLIDDTQRRQLFARSAKKARELGAVTDEQVYAGAKKVIKIALWMNGLMSEAAVTVGEFGLLLDRIESIANADIDRYNESHVTSGDKKKTLPTTRVGREPGDDDYPTMGEEAPY